MRPRPLQIDYPGFEITAADTVVDVGCGDGHVCLHAGHLGAEVVAIDLDADVVGRLAALMREVPARSFRGIVSAADPIPLPDQSATVIVATEVMEHVDDPRRFLGEIVRIGRPGRRYLLSVPDPASESILRAVAPPWYWQKPLHVRVFGREEFASLVTEAGLEVEASHLGGSYWSIWWFLRMAVGMDHLYDMATDSPIVRAWETLAADLVHAPRGRDLLLALDQAIPKSQVLIARKPAAVAASSFGGPVSSGSRLRTRLRGGKVSVGGFDLGWTIRRVR